MTSKAKCPLKATGTPKCFGKDEATSCAAGTYPKVKASDNAPRMLTELLNQPRLARSASRSPTQIVPSVTSLAEVPGAGESWVVPLAQRKVSETSAI